MQDVFIKVSPMPRNLVQNHHTFTLNKQVGWLISLAKKKYTDTKEANHYQFRKQTEKYQKRYAEIETQWYVFHIDYLHS